MFNFILSKTVAPVNVLVTFARKCNARRGGNGSGAPRGWFNRQSGRNQTSLSIVMTGMSFASVVRIGLRTDLSKA